MRRRNSINLKVDGELCQDYNSFKSFTMSIRLPIGPLSEKARHS